MQRRASTSPKIAAMGALAVVLAGAFAWLALHQPEAVITHIEKPLAAEKFLQGSMDEATKKP